MKLIQIAFLFPIFLLQQSFSLLFASTINTTYLYYRVCAVILVIISCLVLTTESNRCFQANEGLSEGCSIPLLKKFPYKTSFTPPCQRHDICYRCVSTNRTSSTFTCWLMSSIIVFMT